MSQFNKHGISWKDYYSGSNRPEVFLPLLSVPALRSGVVPIDQFFDDAAAGDRSTHWRWSPTTTSSLVQDIQFGDQFVSKVVNAVMSSPNWPKTMLIWTYDEHGGYYDHVPPPAAVTPDDVPPALVAGDPPGAFDQYGFRVPCAVVSPYSKRNYVSHTIYDHTSILKTVEEKWNLPALTRRDANANSLFDMLDFHRRPAFLKPPKLPAAPNPRSRAGCLTTGPGTIPPSISRIEGLTEGHLPPVREQNPTRGIGRRRPLQEPRGGFMARQSATAMNENLELVRRDGDTQGTLFANENGTAGAALDVILPELRLPRLVCDQSLKDAAMVDHHGKEVIYVMFVNQDGQGQGILVPDGDRPRQLARVADQVQEWAVEELWYLGRPATWPECPFHPESHPLEPAVIADTALWQCPKTAEPMGAIGELT